MAPDLEDGDGFAARPVGVDDGRHAIVGLMARNSGLNWSPRPMFTGTMVVGQAHLLERYGDLVAVRRRPIVDFDGLAHDGTGSLRR